MSGPNFLLDTNVVLYVLGGSLSTAALPEGAYLLSFITELELLSYPDLDEREQARIEQFIREIGVIGISQPIKEKTIALRRKHHLKLLDAIICATAHVLDASLITNDRALTSVEEVEVIVPEQGKGRRSGRPSFSHAPTLIPPTRS